MNNCLLTIFRQPPVNQSFSTFGVFGCFKNSDRRRDDDNAVFRIGNFQRLIFSISQFEDVFFQNHCSSIFAGQQFVLNSRVAFFNANIISFQLVEIFPAIFIGQSANRYISSTGKHWVRHSDFAFPFRIGQIFPGFRSIFGFQFIRVISNDHVADTNRGPSTVLVFISNDIFQVRGNIIKQQTLILQSQVVGRISNHQNVSTDFVGFDLAGNFSDYFFSTALEPGNFHIRECFSYIRFTHFIDDIRINRGINHNVAFRTAFRICSFLIVAAAAAGNCY